MKLTKMHGLGNDFILFADPQGANKDYTDLAIRLCDRRTGIGAVRIMELMGRDAFARPAENSVLLGGKRNITETLQTFSHVAGTWQSTYPVKTPVRSFKIFQQKHETAAFGKTG